MLATVLEVIMPEQWTREAILVLARNYQPACVLAAAAELDVFALLAQGPLGAEAVAERAAADARAMTMLLDAAVSLGLLEKRGNEYTPAAGVVECLVGDAPQCVISMVRHQAVCMRRWVQLARVVRTGERAERVPSIRGAEADEAAFITAMEVATASVVSQVVEDIGPPSFKHLLDVGGAGGNWTTEFLHKRPGARATLFDLPHVIPMAERRLREAGMLDRVTLAAGDFTMDPLPAGADLAWVSAIVHQNSREQNRHLFRAVADALVDGGMILIRDLVMEESRTEPATGAMFAINMLVNTEGGGTFTFEELRADLEAGGFKDVRMMRRDEGMNSVVGATR
jgi:hypothetical protein